jgi:hypothetical protein
MSVYCCILCKTAAHLAWSLALSHSDSRTNSEGCSKTVAISPDMIAFTACGEVHGRLRQMNLMQCFLRRRSRTWIGLLLFQMFLFAIFHRQEPLGNFLVCLRAARDPPCVRRGQ